MISRMSPTPVREAASISSTSTCRPSAIGDAGLADPAGLDRRPALPVRPGAVQPLGDDPRRRGLADAAHAGQHEGMRDPVRLEGVAERAHHRLLADQVGEGLRAGTCGRAPGRRVAARSSGVPVALGRIAPTYAPHPARSKGGRRAPAPRSRGAGALRATGLPGRRAGRRWPGRRPRAGRSPGGRRRR